MNLMAFILILTWIMSATGLLVIWDEHRFCLANSQLREIYPQLWTPEGIPELDEMWPPLLEISYKTRIIDNTVSIQAMPAPLVFKEPIETLDLDDELEPGCWCYADPIESPRQPAADPEVEALEQDLDRFTDALKQSKPFEAWRIETKLRNQVFFKSKNPGVIAYRDLVNTMSNTLTTLFGSRSSASLS